MPLPTETGSKKYTVAERAFETDVSEKLCRLFVSDFKDFQVLSLYSDLSKRLLAYKILQQNDGPQDVWLSTGFLETIRVDFNPVFELVPHQFSATSAEKATFNPAYTVECHTSPGFRHYAEGLYAHNAKRTEAVRVYLFQNDTNLNILIFEGRNCVFANSFVCQSETEMLYYLLSALQVAGINQDAASVFLDYNLYTDGKTAAFLTPYFTSLQSMVPDMENPDPEIPNLTELLFPNYLLSLCA